MSATCPRCHASVLDADTFCSSCGTRLAAPAPVRRGASPTPSINTGDFRPLPGVTGQPDLRVRKKRRKRRPLYRRKLFVAFAAIVALMLIGTAAGMVYVSRQFTEINQISTPPPIVSGNVFDEGATGEITTDPAQQALELAESGETGEFTIDTSGAAGPAAPGAPGSEETSTPQSASGDDLVDLTRDDQTTTVAGDTDAPPHAATFSLKRVQESSGGSVNILMMGVDARPGEEIDAGVRPDSLSVLHLDGETGSCRILSVPRDTRTELPGYGQTKINHALAVGGIPYQMLVVEQLLGIELDHYGLIDFAGIEGLVDAVGGVTVDNPQAFEHEGITFAQGEISLDGEEALTYARYRYGDDGDFGRQIRQQQIIRALISQTSGTDVVRGATKLLGAVDGHFRTDLSPTGMIDLANDYRSSCTSTTLETATIDGTIEPHPDPLLNMNLSYVILDPRDVDAKVEWLLEGE